MRGWGGERNKTCKAQGGSGLSVQSWRKLKRVVGVKLVSSGRMGLGEAFRFFSVGTGKPLEIWAKM